MPGRVTVRKLRKSYGRLEAVRDVSFEVREGEVFGLLGPNGAGKTTTVECIVGLREADAGEIEISGIDARRHPREVKERIGAALQTTSLQDRITPREALRLYGGFYRTPTAPELLLKRFGLMEKADAPFDSLSGGQRQRLALALAFVNQPELVILDEPTTGLDPQSRRELHAEIMRMRSKGHTVLLTTHNIDEAQKLCDRIAIIRRGEIVAVGTPHDLMSRSASAPTVFVATVPAIGAEAISELPGVHDALPDAGGVRFTSPDIHATLAALVRTLQERRLEITELTVRKATLEDVLIELTAQAGSDEL